MNCGRESTNSESVHFCFYQGLRRRVVASNKSLRAYFVYHEKWNIGYRQVMAYFFSCKLILFYWILVLAPKCPYAWTYAVVTADNLPFEKCLLSKLFSITLWIKRLFLRYIICKLSQVYYNCIQFLFFLMVYSIEYNDIQ